MHKDLTWFSLKKDGKKRKIIKHFEPFLREAGSLEGVIGLEIGELILKGSNEKEIGYKIKSYDESQSCLRLEGLYQGGKQVFKLRVKPEQLGKIIGYLGEKYGARFREDD